jgi:DNA polymerase-4
MDAFFASVEVLDDPTLRGEPVIVGGTPQGRGVVAACSYEARRFGVHSAMPAGRALRLCPDGVFLRPRMARYLEISERIFGVFHRYTPLVEPLSIDEAFLDVVGCERLFGPAETVGRAIKVAIRDEIGLAASVGVAPNKFLAKLASGLEKPDGFVVMTTDDAPARLAALPVGMLWGVGKVTERRLERLGVRLVADLLRLPRARLVAELGELADHLLQLAVGRDDRPVVPDHEAKSIGNETTFAQDIDDEETLREVLDHLVEKVAWRLRKNGLVARTVTLKARYADFTTHTRARSLPRSTDATVVLRDAARELLAIRLGRAGRPLRLIGITASQFERGVGAGQAELFGDRDGARHQELDRILDRVNERFGPVMRRGGPPRRAAPQDK